MDSIRSLMSGLIDYAGLFPPAKLPMPAACESFARARMGNHEWILGRFVCPVSRLREFSAAAAAMMPGTYATSGYREYAEGQLPWRVSALIDGELLSDLETIHRFNDHHAHEQNGLAVIDALEMKVDPSSPTAGGASLSEILDGAIDEIPEEIYPYFEPPAAMIMEGDVRGFIAALSGEPVGAKIRTGGVVREAFPSPAAVARFMAACEHAKVPFKATAGLHHPVRAEYPLTYEPGCPRGVMHGFLNVFLAAIMLRTHGVDATRLEAILGESDPKAFHFTPEGVRWNGLFAEAAQIARAREAFCVSYGSCSFDEPVEELRRLGLL